MSTATYQSKVRGDNIFHLFNVTSAKLKPPPPPPPHAASWVWWYLPFKIKAISRERIVTGWIYGTPQPITASVCSFPFDDKHWDLTHRALRGGARQREWGRVVSAVALVAARLELFTNIKDRRTMVKHSKEGDANLSLWHRPFLPPETR